MQSEERRRLLSLVAFVPQAVLVIASALAYARHDLPLCLFLQTAVFVAFNKVCARFSMLRLMYLLQHLHFGSSIIIHDILPFAVMRVH